MKTKTRKKYRSEDLFLRGIGVFLLLACGIMPLAFPAAVPPLEMVGLLTAALVLWRQSQCRDGLRRTWLLFSAVALTGAVVPMFTAELGAMAFGGLHLLWGVAVFWAAGWYLVHGHLLDVRTLADTGISLLVILSLSYQYLIRPQLAAPDFGAAAFLFVVWFVVLMDIAVTLATLFFSSQRALLPPALFYLGLGLALGCLHFLSWLPEALAPSYSGTMRLFLSGMLLIAMASCCSASAAGSGKITSSMFKGLAGRRLWILFCQILPDMLVFGLFIQLGVHYGIGGVMFTGAMTAAFFLWLSHFTTIRMDEKRLKWATEKRRELRLQNDELTQKSSLAALDASLDYLTQLYNRRYIERAFARPKESADGRIRIGLLLIDVDFFKQVNDTLGHQTGDKALRQVADGIRKAAGSRHIGGRYGGDEFILLLYDVTAEEMNTIANRLLAYVRSTLAYIPVTLSIGGALYEGDITGYDSGALTKEADTALYKSKENGRDRYTSAAEMKAPTGVAAATSASGGGNPR